ncbi:hypothetical protein ABPG72_013008 [Tetrahymena utriculariae]
MSHKSSSCFQNILINRADNNNKVFCAKHWRMMYKPKKNDQYLPYCNLIGRQFYATIPQHKKNNSQTTSQKIINLTNIYNKLIKEGDKIVGIWQIKQGYCKTPLSIQLQQAISQLPYPQQIQSNNQGNLSIRNSSQLSQESLLQNQPNLNIQNTSNQQLSKVISQNILFNDQNILEYQKNQEALNEQFQKKIKYLEDKVQSLECLLNKIVISTKNEDQSSSRKNRQENLTLAIRKYFKLRQ